MAGTDSGADFEAAGEADLIAALGSAAYDYFAGGAGDEVTLRANVTSWLQPELLPRVLVDVGTLDSGVTVLGRPWRHPIAVAPMAYQRHAHPDGERAMAEAAGSTGSTFVLSSQTTTSPRVVAEAAPGVRRWFQLYVFRDRQVSLDLVAEAREAGYEALMITVDFPVGGWRDRDRASGFAVEHPVAVNPGGSPLTTAELFAQHDPTLTWDDVADFAEAAGMPVVLKGILRTDDARRAVDAGAAGVVVSNHGGRQLDTVPTPASVLPGVVDAVEGKVDVLVDGGIRRGWDVAKALALGASAVLVGRPVLWGLARGGSAGAEAVLDQLIAEFDNALALLGCPCATDLDRSYLRL
ncbi:MAG TPA: alpha-hydroxy acid oxidase [Aeromicrobium sp.]|nr:alpha-hydroxy acid oxidase [Aeromicrobium sp.]